MRHPRCPYDYWIMHRVKTEPSFGEKWACIKCGYTATREEIAKERARLREEGRASLAAKRS